MESEDRRDGGSGASAGPAEGTAAEAPEAALPVGGASRAWVEVGTLADGRTIRYFSAAAPAPGTSSPGAAR